MQHYIQWYPLVIIFFLCCNSSYPLISFLLLLFQLCINVGKHPSSIIEYVIVLKKSSFSVLLFFFLKFFSYFFILRDFNNDAVHGLGVTLIPT